MDFYKELEAMLEAYQWEKAPNAMATGYFDFTFEVKMPKSASQLEGLIMEFLRLKGHQAQKVTTTGVYRDNTKKFVDAIGRTRIIGKGTWTPGTATKGAADISSTIYGIKVEWEVKFSKSDTQKPKQKEFEMAVKKGGGFYFIVTSGNDFWRKYYKLLEHPKIITMKGLFHEED